MPETGGRPVVAAFDAIASFGGVELRHPFAGNAHGRTLALRQGLVKALSREETKLALHLRTES